MAGVFLIALITFAVVLRPTYEFFFALMQMRHSGSIDAVADIHSAYFALCIALPVAIGAATLSWKLLPKAKSPMLWISILLLPALATIWMGLNDIRGSTYEYAADYQRHLGDYRQNLYWHVVSMQDWIVWIAVVDFVFSVCLAVTAMFRSVSTEIRRIGQK